MRACARARLLVAACEVAECKRRRLRLRQASEGDCMRNWQDEMLKMNKQTWVAGGSFVFSGHADVYGT